MALNISYFAGTQYGVAKGPMGHESLTTGASNAAATGNPDASVVGLYSDAAHYVAISETATATSGMYLPAGQTFFLALDPGQAVNAITA